VVVILRDGRRIDLTGKTATEAIDTLIALGITGKDISRTVHSATRRRLEREPQKVGELGRAVLGAPAPCPVCGGRLGPAFGQVVDDAGRRRPVMDPNFAICQDCRAMFRTTPDGGGDQ